ncbi:MAG: nucleotidyltransferase domain-containing protein [Candidatus Hodarchaeales archaeon]|jgi:predicted nucleotidyltransferase
MIEAITIQNSYLLKKESEYLLKFCENILEVGKENIKTLILYGSAVREDYHPGVSDINILVILESKKIPLLRNMLTPVNKARKKGFQVFFISKKNLESSTDVFPIKFGAIKESYQVLYGKDYLKNLEISKKFLRLRCEQELKNLLLRMVRYYISQNGTKLKEFLSDIINGFLEDLRVTLHLLHDILPSKEEIISIASQHFDIDDEVLKKMKKIHYNELKLTRLEYEELYNEFMAVVEKVTSYIDQMELRE